jgi:uncharacterized protein (DUF362 family)
MIPRDFPGRGKVAVVNTSPATVLDDVGQVMELAGFQAALPRDHDTLLKINLSWQTWYPACSSTPWQIEGVARTLRAHGYHNLSAAQNKTVVVDAYVGERNNKHKVVVDAYGLRNVHLYEPEVRWLRYTPKAPMLVLDKIFPEGILLPEFFFDKNIVHLPTVKTHVFTTITGAMKNAFGGLLNEKRHWTHGVIHETVVDLLAIQQEIHSGLFAVMDGTFAGDGAGPRAMRWHEKDLILASADQVAIDAISARLQGFNPMELPFIRLAHELGLGVGDPKDIEIVGFDIAGQNWHFIQEDTFASRGQNLIYHGALRPFENVLLRSPIVPWSYLASNLYHNFYWYPFVGRRRVLAAAGTKWGRLFKSYGDGQIVLPGVELGASAAAGVGLLGLLFVGVLLRRRRLLKGP